MRDFPVGVLAIDFRAAPTIQACDPGSTTAYAERIGPRRAAFLDRDGTIIVDKPYDANPDAIELMPEAAHGLRLLRDRGFLLIVITNQSGVARGFYGAAEVAAMHARLDAMLHGEGVAVDAYFYCPHHVDGRVPALAIRCDCRKPSPGAIHRAAVDWGVDLASSWMIGNAESDVAAGRAAGCRSAWVGAPTSNVGAVANGATFVGDTLLRVARQIVGDAAVGAASAQSE